MQQVGLRCVIKIVFATAVHCFLILPFLRSLPGAYSGIRYGGQYRRSGDRSAQLAGQGQSPVESVGEVGDMLTCWRNRCTKLQN